MNKKGLAEKALFACVTVLLAVYMGMFAYLNLAKYGQHVDSDIAAEAMLAREIWETKSLTPDNWLPSTERRVLGTSMVGALFYGITGSMVTAMGIACVLVGLCVLVSLALLLKQCRVSALGLATALLAVCALPTGGLRNEGQIVPFVMLLWFLFADYYALHCVCLFLSLAFYIRLHRLCEEGGRLKKTDIVIWCALALGCVGLGLGGMRCLQVLVLPLAAWELLSLFAESGHLTKAVRPRRWIQSGFVLSLLGAAGAAAAYPSSREYPMFLQNAQGMVQRLLSDVPAAILECLGIAGNAKLTSFSGLMQLIVLAVAALTVFGAAVILRRGSAVCREQKLLIQLLLSSLCVTVFTEVATTAETAHNYFFMVWFLVIAVIAVLITGYGGKGAAKGSAFGKVIALCVCVFAVLNIKYTYAEAVSVTDNLQPYEEVAEYMEAQGLDYGYAEFWDAARICVMSDGRITMGHSYQIEQLRMYWWLTNINWYVPNLPEDMRTAYVVRTADREGFLAQFEDPSVMELGFENESFAVYVSDKNFVRAW